MKRKLNLTLNQITFMIMFVVILISAAVTINCKINTNKFMEDYNIKYEALEAKITNLSAENDALKAQVTSLVLDSTEKKSEPTVLAEVTLTEKSTEETKNASIVATPKENATPVSDVKNDSEKSSAIPNVKEEEVAKAEVTSTPVDNSNTKESNSQPTVVINTTDLGSKSNLTAEQFNTVIKNVFAKYHKTYEGNKFENIGGYLVKMENEYNVNGLFALAIGSLESGYGTSNLAKNHNNLFGIWKNGGYGSFDSIDDNIQYWGKNMANGYINKGYTTISKIGSKYCPGSTKWASDISWFWGVYTNAANNL